MKGTDLKKLRQKLGLSLAEASLQVHVTARAWCRWEAGDRRIPEGAVELFCTKNGLDYPQEQKK
jgi:DNA-binding transcriptional regulator YiaG